MKNKRKNGFKLFVSIGTLVMVVLSLVGCGNINSPTSKTSIKDAASISTQVKSTPSEATPAKKVAEEHPIKIEDINWSVEKGVIDGNRGIVFNYTNNSKYTIAHLEIKFVQKESTTAEQLAVFDKFKKDNKLSDDYIASMYITGSSGLFADQGEKVADSPCTFNGTVTELVENIEQYKLMEPDMATIDYIGNDGKLYEQYYDFKTQKYGDSAQGGKNMHEWSNSRICSRLPKADFRRVQIGYDNEDYSFFFFAWGVSREEFKAYGEACKEKGFAKEVSSGDYWFRASNEDGYYVDMSYVSKNETMTCLIMILKE